MEGSGEVKCRLVDFQANAHSLKIPTFSFDFDISPTSYLISPHQLLHLLFITFVTFILLYSHSFDIFIDASFVDALLQYFRAPHSRYNH